MHMRRDLRLPQDMTRLCCRQNVSKCGILMWPERVCWTTQDLNGTRQTGQTLAGCSGGGCACRTHKGHAACPAKLHPRIWRCCANNWSCKSVFNPASLPPHLPRGRAVRCVEMAQPDTAVLCSPSSLQFLWWAKGMLDLITMCLKLC